jgi:hypothetical protein
MGQIRRQGEQFETHVIADKYGNLLDYGPDSGVVDAFGRQRVSNPYTLFDSTMRFDKRSDQWYEITTGGATTNFLANASTLELKTTTASGDTVLRRTKQRFPYQPGKAMRHGEPVLTPKGWKSIEELIIGDEVFDGDGAITEVIGVYPQGERDIYRLNFDDGSFIDADGDHLWVTLRRWDSATFKKGDEYILTTKEMIQEYGEQPLVYKRWRIPCCPVLQIERKDVDVDPYTMGAILGDAHIAANGSVTFTTADKEVLEYLVCDRISDLASRYAYGLNGLTASMRKYRLEGKLFDSKSVPNDYKFNCYETRLQVLRGLMDTDGWIEKDKCCYYASGSINLAEDVAFLVRSLGGNAKITKKATPFYVNNQGVKIYCSNSYKVTVISPVNPFRLTRKAGQWRSKYRTSFDRYVHSIEKIDRDQATCIVVKSDRHTFLAKNHIVTHNSLVALQSFVGAPLAPGLIQEVGYFDDNNGVMVRASGTTLQFVVRSFTTGSVIENVVNQSAWNLETFSALDFNKAQIFSADFEWLGVGRVRCGFVIDGSIVYCHEFNHANVINRTYMQTAILPLSYRMSNTTAQASGATFQQICCSLLSEGGYEPDGATYSVNHSLITVPNVNGERVTAGIRMASGRTGNVILPVKIDIASESSNVVAWKLRLNPTLSGVTWAPAVNGRGNVETITSASSVSGGTIVNTGIISQGQSVNLNVDTAIRLALGVNASGVSDTLILTVDSEVNSKALGQLGWVEIV